MRMHVTCIFLFMNIVLATMAREPYCPPCPSCEERLLERVIRNELAMETLRKELLERSNRNELSMKNSQEEMGTKLNNTIKIAMTNITNAVSEITQNASMTGLQLKKDNEILKGSLRTTVDNAIKTAMTNISNAVSEMTQNAKTTELQLKKQNEILKDQLTVPLIHFHAFEPADNTLDNGQVVVYTQVQDNEGQCYNPANGKFTASVPGLYLFMVHYDVGQSAMGYLGINHQGTFKQKSYVHTVSGNFVSAFMQVFIRVAKSDQIWVEATSSGFLFNRHLISNSFAGALIHI